MTVQDESSMTTEAAVPEPSGPTGAWWRRPVVLGLVAFVIVLLVGLAVPSMVGNTYYMAMILNGVILSILALSIGFLARYCGMISMAHSAFYGSSAYAVAIGITRWEWSPLFAVLVAVVVGTVIAAVIGSIVVRTTGMSFLMLTLAFGQMFYVMCLQQVARPFTGAHDGLLIEYQPGQSFLGLQPPDLLNAASFWPIAWVAFVVVAFVIWIVSRLRFGTVLEGIRDNEERMRFSGFNTVLPRLVAFVLSGLFASIGGALFALNAAYVSPELFSFTTMADVLIATLIGGVGTLLGPFLGTMLFAYTQAELNIGGNVHLYTGVALVIVLMFFPSGISGGLARGYHRIKDALGQRRKDS